MKTAQTPSRHASADYKSVGATPVPVTTLKLSARTRNQQRNEGKSKRSPLEKLKQGFSKLSEPRQNYQQPDNRCQWKITRNVLKYKASKRIQSLARPRSINPKASETIPSQSSFQSTVSTRALNYVPTQRILELARPRRYNITTDLLAEVDDEF